MSIDRGYLRQLLSSWEETYKKGQLTLWMLLALKDSPKYMGDIRTFISEITGGMVSCEEQSIYRAMRKFYDLNIVDFELRDGQSGPSRKYYYLTEIGEALLEAFIDRNIKMLYSPGVSKLFK